MSNRRTENELFLVLWILTGILIIGSSSSVTGIVEPVQALQQSQITTCTGINSCQTLVCNNDELCHTFRSNSDRFAHEQPENDAVIIQPEEKTATIVQPEKGTVTQSTDEIAGTTLAP